MTFHATFRVDGLPKGQPRAKATMRGKHAGVYDPGTANGWKVQVSAAGRPQRPAEPIGDAPLGLKVIFYLPRPKRLCRKQDDPGVIPCITKPDIDNLTKAVMDSMTQDGWWVDDAQVTTAIVEKVYHAIGDRPGARVTIWTI